MHYFVTGWVIGAIIGYFLGNIRGNGIVGVILSLLLGPLGWLFVLFLSDSRPKCRMCQGALDAAGVRRCRHCGCDFPASPSQGSSGRTFPLDQQHPKKKDPFEDWEDREKAIETAKRVGLPPIHTERNARRRP